MVKRANGIVRESQQQELDLPASESLRTLIPSPKRDARRTRERRHLPWETNYAAFSTDFAKAAVEHLCTPRRLTIVDPFVGNGTTLEAAAEVGIAAYGIELNPYSALLSRCRVSTTAQFEYVDEILRMATKARKRLSLSAAASPLTEPSKMIESLLQVVASRAQCTSNDLIATLCSQSDARFDSEVVALVAGLHVVKKQAAVHYRSNPAWLIRGHSPDREEGDTIPIEDLVAASGALAELMVSDLHRRGEGTSKRSITVFAGSFQNAPIGSKQINRFLTSPPYLNRLDYVNPTLPELHVLGWQDVGRLEELRAQMMGTTKMRQTSTFAQLASPTAIKLLDAIAAHPTKASGTYYLKFFRQYFEDMVVFLNWLRSRSTPTCRGIVVLQDSFYKEIKIPIVQIMSELAFSIGFSVEVLQEEKRTRHMGTLSPHQRAHAPDKALTEYTLMLKR